MSFILKDKNLLNELLKLAQVPAPVPALAASPDQVKSIAKKFVDNLTQQTSQDKFTSSTGDANLSTKHLRNLSELLNFLSAKGISFGNLKLVLSHANQAFSSGVAGDAAYKSLDPQSQSLYVKYPDVDGDQFQYWVYKNGVIEYVQDLQQQATEQTPRGHMLRPFVGPDSALVREINDALETDVNKKPEKSPSSNQDGYAQTGQNSGLTQPVTYVDQQGQITDTGVQYLSSNAELPLRDEDVDFPLLRRFATVFRNFGNPQATANADALIGVLDKIAQNYPNKGNQQLVGVNYEMLANEIYNNSAHKDTSPGPYIALVAQAIQQAGIMLGILNTMLRRANSPAIMDYQKDVQDQIDNKYRRNMYAITSLQGQMQNAFRNMQQQGNRK